jgi:uncharacterized membrane protein
MSDMQETDADAPTRSDPVVRGLSQAIGGPMGAHAARRPRFRRAAWIVLALTLLTLTAHWVQKSPCRDGAWRDLNQYKHFCYTDVLALYYAEGLSDGAVPYAGHAVEYPVLTGAFMGAIGLPVHAYGQAHPGFNQGQAFYDLNAVLLAAFAVATVAFILAMRRRRPWDAALFALSPALLVTATVNWDLLAVVLAAAGLFAWSRRRPVLAGVLLGLGTAAKLWPGFLLIVILLLAVRTANRRAVLGALSAGAAAVVVWLAVNLPVALAYPTSWLRFFELNRTRAIDWGTFWYVGEHLPGGVGTGPFHWLGRHVDPTLNWLTYLLFALSCVGIAALALLAPRRPRLGQLAFLVVAAFLLFSKVWSQQYVLWLLLPLVLARPRWGAYLIWQAAEVLYFVSFYGELMGASGRQVFPEGVFVLAATLRWAAVVMLCVLVVREILRPELDVVRRDYADDPDGGLLDGLDSPPLGVRGPGRGLVVPA